mgnify:CR=1 FL=1
MITYEEIRKNEDIRTYIQSADEALAALGFTEHSFAHVTKVAESVKYILETLGFSAHAVELGMIAAYLHDIGNLVNRAEHSQSGAVMAFRILDRMDMPAADIATIVAAIGNHDEGTGVPVNAIAAALILADKSDVRRSRVRDKATVALDIHDRVNYSVTDCHLEFDEQRTSIRLILTVDTELGSVMEYLEIFMKRMLLCQKAAQALGLTFHLVINGQLLV